jgi:hypothetical protein
MQKKLAPATRSLSLILGVGLYELCDWHRYYYYPKRAEQRKGSREGWLSYRYCIQDDDLVFRGKE